MTQEPMKDADVRREGLIKKLLEMYVKDDYSCMAIADFIIDRERSLQSRVEELEAVVDGKAPSAGFWGRSCARQSNKIKTLESENATLKSTIAEMVQVLKNAQWMYVPHDPRLVHPLQACAPQLCNAIDKAISISEGK